LDSENIVVGREHVHGRAIVGGSLEGDRNLGVVDAGEVACTTWLVLLWAKREGVGVNTWVWAASVVSIWLHLVEVLATLLLHAVLTVKHKLEGRKWTDGAGRGGITILEPGRGTTFSGTREKHWRTSA